MNVPTLLPYYSIIINMYWWCCFCHTSCLADCVVTSYFPIPITNGITIIKLGGVFLLQTFQTGGMRRKMADYYCWRWLLTHIWCQEGEIVVLTEQQSTYALIYTVEDIRKEEVVMYQSYERRDKWNGIGSSLSLFNIILYPYSQLQYCDIACMHAVLFAMMHPPHISLRVESSSYASPNLD